MSVRQSSLMSPQLLNIYMDGWMRKVKDTVRDLGMKLKIRRREQSLVADLFTGRK